MILTIILIKEIFTVNGTWNIINGKYNASLESFLQTTETRF